MEPVAKMVIPTRLATRKGQLEASSTAEIDELISSLIIAKAGLIAAAAAVAAASQFEADRQDDAPSASAGQAPCWCGHAARVHNVVGHDGGRGFCTECSPGRCGRYETAKRLPEAVITDSERDCQEKNPESGFYCYRSGQHHFHRDSDGKTWTTHAAAAAQPQWCTYQAEDGRACARPAHPADEPHAGADGIVIEPEPVPPLLEGGVMFPAGCDPDAPPALASVTPLRPDHEVIPATLIPCNEAHPSLGTLCTGKYPHPMPHVDPDGQTWSTSPLSAVTS
jgi:hypothetical protein